jgi:PAS domain S-box-containing protein
MTWFFPAVILVSAVADAVIGAIVLATNPSRSSNRGFVFLCSMTAVWLVCMFAGAMSSDPRAVDFWVRQTIVASLAVPFAGDAFRLSLTSERFGWREVWAVGRWWLIAWVPAALLCQTEFFLVSVAPSATHLHIPAYGPGFALGVTYMLGAFAVLAWRFMQTLNKATGVQRTEVLFVFLGCFVSLGTGIAIWIVWTLASIPEVGALSTAPVVLLQGVIAYGIATRRILGVRHILRRATAHVLMAAYLIAVYAAAYWAALWLARGVGSNAGDVAHLAATVVAVLAVLPGAGWMQRFAAHLFITDKVIVPERLLDQGNAIMQSVTTVDDLLEQVTRLLREAAGTDRVVVLLRHGEGLRQMNGHEPGAPGLALPASDPLVAALGGHGGILALDSIRRRPSTPDLSDLAAGMARHGAALCLGIRLKGTLKGILLLGRRVSGRSYDDVEQRALLLVCDQLAGALENAELYTALQNAKVHDENLLASLTCGVVVVGTGGTVTVFNREAARLTGLRAEDAAGVPVERLPAELAEPLKFTLARRAGVKDEEVMVRSEGGGRTPVQINTSLFFGPANEPLGAMLVMNDITAVKKLEEQVRRTDHLASLGTLTAGMAHEIKNPLVSIKTFAQLLPERYTDEEFRQTFSVLVGQEVQRIDGLVARLLNFSRPAASELRPLHLHEMIKGAIGLVAQQLRRKGIAVVLELGADCDWINGDPEGLSQVFVNFFLNAEAAMAAKGELRVSTSPAEPGEWVSSRRATAGHPGVRVLVSDTGCGILPEHLARVFDPFFTTKNDGTGLGLSVAHRILTEHGAQIELRSTPGAGTTVDVVFPLLREVAVQ